MKLGSIVGYACNVVGQKFDDMARGQPASPDTVGYPSNQSTFMQSALAPSQTRLSPDMYREVIDVINQALTESGYNVTDEIKNPLARLGPNDAGLFIPEAIGSRPVVPEVSVIAADPRAITKRWEAITSRALAIARERDSRQGDKPIGG